jgi:Bacterial extracellular solute-binding protein
MFAAIRGIALHGAWALCLAAGLFSAPARAETLDELYTKAKTEKSLVIYAGGPVSNYEPLAREFESKFPGLTVSIEGGFSNVLNQKIERQFSDQRLEADMALFQTAQDFVRWKGQGKMLAFKPEGFDAVDKSFKDRDGAFIVWYVGTLSYAYNTQQVKAENAPKSALDFLKGEFRGKMIACYPHDDDATLYLFHTLAKKYGSDYIDISGERAQLGAGSSERLALGGCRHERRHARCDDLDHPQSEEGRPADRVRFLGGGSDSDLLLHRRHFQGRAAPQRREALPDLGSGARTAAPHRNVLFARRRTAAGRTKAAILLRRGQRLSGFRDQRPLARRSAQ